VKILQVTTHFNIGGITNYIMSLSKALRGRNVLTVVATSGGNMEQELDVLGIKHERLGIDTKFEFGPKVIRSAFRIKDIIRREKIDLMHAHSRVSQVACRIASYFTGVPYVTTCHGYFKKRSRGLVDTWGAKVIAISDAVRKHLIEDLGVDASRIEVIYNGVDMEKFLLKYPGDALEDVRKAIGFKKGPVVGTIGRLSSVKGQRFLIHAMPYIISQVPDAQAVIVGSGEEDIPLKNLARSLHLTDRVSFMRSDPDTARILSVMDVFVFPSIKEGLGLALLEAMASGVPCVASDIGGIKDIIGNNERGILVPVGDSEKLAKAVVRLIQDPAARSELALKGRAAVMEKYTIDRMADEILKLYEKITL